MRYLRGKKIIITVNKNIKGTYQDFPPTSPLLNKHARKPTLDLEMKASLTKMNESKMKREW
jgi:hypothetical protein